METDSIEATLESCHRRTAEGLAAMTEEQLHAPFAEGRAYFYVSPEERKLLLSLGGEALAEMIAGWDRIFRGEDNIFAEDGLALYLGNEKLR